MHSPRVGAGPAKAPRTGSLGLALWVQLRHPPCARRHCAGGILSTWACVRVCLRRPPRTLIASGRPSGSRPGSSATPVLNARSAEAAAPASSASTPHAPQNALPPDLPPPSRLCRRSAARRRREEASSTIARRRSGFERPSAAEKRVAARPSQQHRSAGTQPLLCRASEAMLTTHPSLFAIGAAQGRARACVTQGGKLRHACTRVATELLAPARLRLALRCTVDATLPAAPRLVPRWRCTSSAPPAWHQARGGPRRRAARAPFGGRPLARWLWARWRRSRCRRRASCWSCSGSGRGCKGPSSSQTRRPKCAARYWRTLPGGISARAASRARTLAALGAQGLPLQNRVGGDRSLAAPELAARSLTSWRGVAQVLCPVCPLDLSAAGPRAGWWQEARGWSSRAWWPPSAHFSPRDVRLAVGGGGFD